jgi:CRP-like cAMP-binding protein
MSASRWSAFFDRRSSSPTRKPAPFEHALAFFGYRNVTPHPIIVRITIDSQLAPFGSQPGGGSAIDAKGTTMPVKALSDSTQHIPARRELFQLSKDENRLLIAADPSDRALLKPHLDPVTMLPGDVLFEAGASVEHIYFPQSGVVSLLTPMLDGTFVECGTIGREGAAGLLTGVGGGQALNRAIVQIAGRALRIKTVRFREILSQSTTLQEIRSRYNEALLSQVLQTVACNTLHSVEQRFCRWLLICRDRTGSDLVPLTQEALAEMLGVQRTTVTAAARTLQARGLIRYRRGVIECVDIEGLQGTSCECYEAMRSVFERLLPFTYRDPPGR